MSTSQITSSPIVVTLQNVPKDVGTQFAEAIHNNDTTALEPLLQEIDRRDPAISTLTKLALISDSIRLEIKEKLFEGSEIDIDEAISHGESVRGYAERRDDTALLKVLTNKANTTNTVENSTLEEKLKFEMMAGMITGSIAGAFATPIDKGVIEVISGSQRNLVDSMRDSAKQLIPGQQRNIAKAYLAVAGACTVTYSIANAVETTAAHYGQDPMPFKLGLTTLFNTAVSIKRDITLSKLLIPGNSAGALSRASVAFWGMRDGLTMFGVFGPQAKLRQYVQNSWNLSEQSAAQITQVVAPAVMQIAGSVAHILGVDYYKNPNISFSNRLQTVKANYASTLLGRGARIGIAYGIFANVNTYVRGELSPSKKL